MLSYLSPKKLDCKLAQISGPSSNELSRVLRFANLKSYSLVTSYKHCSFDNPRKHQYLPRNIKDMNS